MILAEWPITAEAVRLENEGLDPPVVLVDPEGRVNPADLLAVTRDETAFISVMPANNSSVDSI